MKKLFFSLIATVMISTCSFANTNEIKEIKLGKDRRFGKSNALKLVRIKIKTRIRPFVVRPSDYENENELLKKFHQLKLEVEKV